MINVGVIGLGMMGLTHLDVYDALDGVKVVAIADPDEARRTGKTKARGNVEGQAQGGFDVTKVTGYAEGMDLIADPNVQLVDICLPTPLHKDFTLAALEAGKHVLVEKPLARSSADAFAIADAAEQAYTRTGALAMPAMCIRFWPGWTWAKRAIDDRRYGRVLSARFTRLASHPGGAFYQSAEASGAAALDLHIHDVDFIRFCFGMPRAVRSSGYSKVTTGVDHLLTQYLYDDVPLVTAEGGWCMQKGFPFQMAFTLNFERATAVYDLNAPQPLVLYQDGRVDGVPIDPVMGYRLEIEYFLACIATKRLPQTVTLRDAAEAVRIVEAEVESARTGREIPLS
jgi:predicted dehydrogenase